MPIMEMQESPNNFSLSFQIKQKIDYSFVGNNLALWFAIFQQQEAKELEDEMAGVTKTAKSSKGRVAKVHIYYK